METYIDLDPEMDLLDFLKTLDVGMGERYVCDGKKKHEYKIQSPNISLQITLYRYTNCYEKLRFVCFRVGYLINARGTN